MPNYNLDKAVSDMGKGTYRPTQETEITEAMLVAGAEVLAEQFGDEVTFQPSLGAGVAKLVYQAMAARRQPYGWR